MQTLASKAIIAVGSLVGKMVWSFFFVCVVIAVILAILWVFTTPLVPWVLAFGLGAYVLFWVAVAIWYATDGAMDITHRRFGDPSARRILRSLERGQKPEFWLYLRPFRMDRVLTETTPQSAFDSLWDTTLLTRGRVPFLVALGYKDRHEVASLPPVVDKLWWEEFKLLADHAAGIISVPLMSSSTGREIDYLQASGYFNKCIFAVPSESGMEGSGTQYEDSPALAEWRSDSYRAAAERLKTCGIDLPEYRDIGFLFRINASGRAYDMRVHAYEFETRVYCRAFEHQFGRWPTRAEVGVAPELNNYGQNSFRASAKGWEESLTDFCRVFESREQRHPTWDEIQSTGPVLPNLPTDPKELEGLVSEQRKLSQKVVSRRCPICDGRGDEWHSNPRLRKTCEACKGSGRVEPSMRQWHLQREKIRKEASKPKKKTVLIALAAGLAVGLILSWVFDSRGIIWIFVPIGYLAAKVSNVMVRLAVARFDKANPTSLACGTCSQCQKILGRTASTEFCVECGAPIGARDGGDSET